MFIHTAAKKIKDIEFFVSNIYQSSIAFGKVILLSKFFLIKTKAVGEKCIVLGNGPSLSATLEKYSEVIKKFPLICVNNFATSKEFHEYRPSHYIILDPGFFIQKQRPDIVATFNELKNKVNWEMDFFIPYLYRKDSDVREIIKNNPSVKVYYFNYTIIKGFDGISFWLFRLQLGMIQFFNVLGASIFIGINLGYKEIWMVGADHTWFLDIHVGADNRLSRKDKHFYDPKGIDYPLLPLINPIEKKPQRIGDFFDSMQKVFNSYYKLNRYAESRNCKVYNASEFSFIDAFERKPLSE